MSFVNYVAGAPGYTGSLETTPTGIQGTVNTSASIRVGYTDEGTVPGGLDVLKSPVYNPEGVLINGWQTLQGGGGGPTRPTSGMIYPRGTG